MNERYIGLMSGTSLDGVDGVLVAFEDDGAASMRVLANAKREFTPALGRELLALNTAGENELHRSALASNALARAYAEVVAALLSRAGATPQQVRAVGVHGQTVRHRPGEFDRTGYTIQLNNPALLAELCRIDVVADLRSRDVAAGGQGAPLVPAFHRAYFGRPGESVAILNLGGIANLTVLHADGATLGFDCGPGNALMDHWCRQHTGRPFDEAGAWAASGHVIEPLLAQMLGEPYFAAPPPKSTGRDRFHAGWLDAHRAQQSPHAAPADIQATLAELTASACATDVLAFAADARELLVCGGGAFNRHVLCRLAVRLPGMRIRTTDERGLPAMQVEAGAFAWLARAFVRRDCANLASVTGAAGPRLLGALYPAG